MAVLRSANARESLNQQHTILDMRIAGATNAVLQAIGIIDRLVQPKRFYVHNVHLRRFESAVSTGEYHLIRTLGDIPIDEIAEWQINGTAGDRIINVVVTSIFHTHEHNRSGSTGFFINGKPNYRPEYGGITLNDIWQESGLYKQFGEATTLHIIKQSKRGKIIQRYH